MRIIPVIDLMNGAVVHAKKGNRDDYRPLVSPLCLGSSPSAVMDGLLALHPFDSFYFADLDALMGRGDHEDFLNRLQLGYPAIRFWVDRGLPHRLEESHGANRVPVIGSESLNEKGWEVLREWRGEYILSLDFKGDRLLGPEKLLEASETLPEKIIVMNLARVGANEGPDFKRLGEYRALWPAKQIIAAGGVRGEEDLARLEEMGVDCALLASALHSGVLGASTLRMYA